MYKEVAIDPECMKDFSYYSLIKMEFGFEKGRYISAVIKQWAREAYPHVKGSDMPPVRKKSITNFLNGLMKSRVHELFLLADYRRTIAWKDWIDWWSEQNQKHSFALTLSEGRVENSVDYMAVLEGAECWKIKPTLMLDRNPDEIVDVLEPLLKISSELTIIDLYFSFAENKTLVELLRRIQAVGAKISDFHLITAIETSDPSAVFEREYRSLVPESMNFRVTEVPQRYIHDRYFITNSGALKAGYGFKDGVEQGAPADKLSVNLASLEECDHVMRGVSEAYAEGKARVVFPLP
ncbi:hypothetical protein [Microbulbifer sp. YPW16]|uniref:hypothetical protein n=1 Tax=Microbulbifer sp. YPW16 TaxID=2904242 RepID=UPI001E617E02|nr:hypothetical protein [Microbulbifer sp. YPW16]UHQ55327.1 hypothetical protein LVE68_17750 [Microbulbifer sp. YPW16]